MQKQKLFCTLILRVAFFLSVSQPLSSFLPVACILKKLHMPTSKPHLTFLLCRSKFMQEPDMFLMPIAHCARSICFLMSVDHLYAQNSTGTLYLSSSLALSSQPQSALLLHYTIDHVRHLPSAPSHPFLQLPTLVESLYSHLASIRIFAIPTSDTAQHLKENVS